MVAWARTAPDEIFEVNPYPDIYLKVRPELGPYESLLHRRAVMLEVMRVLAGFESSWDWTEGVDTSRLGPGTPANSEAGAWQVSWDSRSSAPGLQTLLLNKRVMGAVHFQQLSKFDHPFAMEWVSRLMRFNVKHNGPLYKGSERLAIRKSLRDPKHSIYPWLRKGAVAEFMEALA